ncbi:hypothetical protein FNV43_RR02050 [Rhamnella rubrinervis]|uniref:BHLH domain-containing protein n=1 Tax=Rhamnella rubrinervis TaxID=2594499 RepID=A0A8K0HTA1_9ROSA|nr:hypothetical protein FNV43_RR02050 [Rhamnella rubrinervis]
MFPSTSSSSPPNQKPMAAPSTGLTRYGSAPGSLLTSVVDSVIGGADPEFRSPSTALFSRCFSGDSSSVTTESTCKVNSSSSNSVAVPNELDHHQQRHRSLHRSYCLNEIASRVGSSSPSSAVASSSSSSSSLVRQRSSPAGLLSHLAAATTDNNAGFSVTRGAGSYSSQAGTNGGHGVSRLKSQLSFTRQDSLSQISEVSENIVDGGNANNGHQNVMHAYATTSFGMDSWDNNTNSIVFSAPSSKRAKHMDGDIFSCYDVLESQFSLPETTLEMATVEKLLQIPEDSVPCKIRAKRGCATHPRSIAERERRTRISGKLKKLQELVPNMDKQTSYADMLDLAVQHIKGLQNQVQVRNQAIAINKIDRCNVLLHVQFHVIHRNVWSK